MGNYTFQGLGRTHMGYPSFYPQLVHVSLCIGHIGTKIVRYGFLTFRPCINTPSTEVGIVEFGLNMWSYLYYRVRLSGPSLMRNGSHRESRFRGFLGPTNPGASRPPAQEPK